MLPHLLHLIRSSGMSYVLHLQLGHITGFSRLVVHPYLHLAHIIDLANWSFHIVERQEGHDLGSGDDLRTFQEWPHNLQTW